MCYLNKLLQFLHKLKQQIRDRSGYEKLNTHLEFLDEITTTEEEENQTAEEDNEFVYTVITNIKQNNHIIAGLCITAAIIFALAVLMCVFRKALRTLCKCCCTKTPPAFTADYTVRNDEVS